MKKWNAAEIEELNIEETAYGIFGWYKDGGRVGDGILTGHLTFDKNEAENNNNGGNNNNDTNDDVTNGLS